MVITDRLSKDLEVILLKNINTETIAYHVINRVISYYRLLTAIVSDRGKQWTRELWRRICELLNIKQRLSTAFRPETDGATERANQTVQDYIRHFVDHNQTNWASLIPILRLAVNSQEAASTHMSPFFLQHGFYPRLGEELDITPLIQNAAEARSSHEVGETIVIKLRKDIELA